MSTAVLDRPATETVGEGFHCVVCNSYGEGCDDVICHGLDTD
ncbi:MAG: hypothetical protein ACK5MT_19320 [Actinomycetales bacterium]